MEGIHTLILSKIFALDKIPTSIQEWYDKTFIFDAQYQRFQEISSQNKGFTPQTRKTNAPRYVHSPRNPNAMDIDRLTTEDRELCMCFFHVSHRYIFCFSQDLSMGNMLYLFQTNKETLVMFQKDKF